MTPIRTAILAAVTSAALAAPVGAAVSERVKITGEVIDTWCYLSEIMYAQGTAHHQCAIWCAAGGIPVGILADDGQVYMVLKFEADETSVANPAVLKIQSNRVSVAGDLFKRDGINYLLVNQVVDNEGIVNPTHDEYGIQPFGE